MSITLTRLTTSIKSKTISALLLAAAADFLLYEHYTGWVEGLFCLLCLLAAVLHQPRFAQARLPATLFLAALGLTVALMFSAEALPVHLFSITLTAFALLPKYNQPNDVRHMLRGIMHQFLFGWLRIYKDSILLLYVRKRLQKKRTSKHAALLHWFLPITCTLAFAALFAQANPIISHWTNSIDLQFLRPYLSIPRILFWLTIMAASWALLRPKLRRRHLYTKQPTQTGNQFTLGKLLFNPRSITTSLVLFNLLFLMQNIMDIAFLWSGAALPKGMTYATYAHEGAYPLIATALLAAAFILLAFQPGEKPSQRLRTLVYGWVAQNLFLVLSSAARLYGYVGEYSLTGLRVSAFIWMGLVALGLALILIRIITKRSNRWLINSNAIALYATLYLCCFINFGGIIATYNVTHSNEVTGKNIALDIHYLENNIGVPALPALIWLEQNHPNLTRIADIRSAREALERNLYVSIGWREWTIQKHWIAQKVALLNASTKSPMLPKAATPPTAK